ncbi:GNAT family N-acetyltransferase [Roseobacter ponti]|uniref:GNAT family N-acetyltransferase n=1 Tax=Roseobacter ponti TaxID=1891787 RepID=A0A858T0Q6_9RHOB|nr:GNAT family N-acetyltransferase [Roseobacter ponti]QJF52796.1 GNAT family N-acetyltransferase [Roseobacter ponti]
MIRWTEPGCAPALAEVMFRAVREGESPYSEAQRAAWMPARPEPAGFATRLAGYDCAVAEAEGLAQGFMTLARDGYIDLAFILPQARGCGIFRALVDAIVARARLHDIPRLWTQASLMAEPAFQATGFQVIQRESVQRSGQHLPRALMERHLT